MSSNPPPDAAGHPLDPLTADEFRQVASVLRRDRGVGDRWRFASIELREPAKESLTVRYDGTGAPVPREALAVCWDRDTGLAYRAVVSLAGDAVVSWDELPGQQPNMTVDEWHECDVLLHGDPRLIEALARRGITDLSRVVTDMWAYPPAQIPPRYRGLRLGWADVWYRGSEQGSPYAHHLSGLHPVDRPEPDGGAGDRGRLRPGHRPGTARRDG